MIKSISLIVVVMALVACQQQAADPKPESVSEVLAPTACTKDLKVCEYGQRVGRDSNNQCEFFPCPPTPEVTACPEDMKQCPDGSFVYRDQSKACEFKPCPIAAESQKPEPMMCTQDVKQCPDGSYVGRDSMNNCAFKPCKSKDNLE